MIIPFAKPTGPAQARPDVDPTYLAMAAAQMHSEGRWPQDQDPSAQSLRSPTPTKRTP